MPYDYECKRCGKYSNNSLQQRWCKSCQINDLRKNFTNWTSGNEKIDSLIQEKQLKIDKYFDIIVEWIPYDKFDDIKELGKDEFSTIYSAIWKDGPLKYDKDEREYSRKQSIEVNLKLYNSQNIINEFLNEADNNELKIYGISQNSDTKDYILVLQNVYCNKCGKKLNNIYYKWCNPCQINDFKKNFTNWTSGNEKIDSLIQEKQLEIGAYNNIIVEWIPYDKFDDIKELGKDEFSIIYSAIWKDGPLEFDRNKREYSRKQSIEVNLKLYNSENITNEFLNEADNNELKIYGISQNSDTKDYILVLQNVYCNKCGKKLNNIYYKWCNPCQINDFKKNFTNWTSGNEKIDSLIQEKQLEIDKYDDIIVEWIPYDKFDDIKELGKYEFSTIYSAIWKYGPLQYDRNEREYSRKQSKKVNLKSYNSQNINGFINEVNNELKIYGISQNPYTKNYIITFPDGYCNKCVKILDNDYKWCKSCQINDFEKNFTNWTSGNEKIDSLIQEKQLEIDKYDDIIVEWIPYDKFDDIKELGKYEFSIIYSAIWKDGPLQYDRNEREYSRKQSKKVNLKLYNSQNITNEFLNEAKVYFERNHLYGISQNPYTKNYIISFPDGFYCNKCGKKFTNNYKWCKSCQINDFEKNFRNWTSGNEKIDSLIQEKQLEIDKYDDIIVEWIPYDKFDDIKELGKNEFSTIYSAIWKDGPLQYDRNEREYSRKQSKKVNFTLYNSQNINGFLNEVNNELKIYGISQNPYTKNYIITFPDGYCNKCVKILDNDYKWCKSCQINDLLENNFTNWTSENEKIVNLIQEMQSKINSYKDIIFEWIPYNQFDNIKEIGKGGFAKVYSAIWVDGPLSYNSNTQKYTRNQYKNKNVALKCLYNSQNITSEFLNEAKLYSIKNYKDYYGENKILKIYGISQNPDTKEYIIVLDYAKVMVLKKFIKRRWSTVIFIQEIYC
ncbi:unnamed protein product [Rhizophagus irregularis]|nr:unnamed protein product [Rhizophagus irregularis]